jgi:hypothetical protein
MLPRWNELFPYSGLAADQDITSIVEDFEALKETAWPARFIDLRRNAC